MLPPLLLLCPHTPVQVFNISGERYVTFDGLARACAKAAGAPEPEIIHFNAKDFDFGKKKVRRSCCCLTVILAICLLRVVVDVVIIHFNAKDLDFGKKKVGRAVACVAFACYECCFCMFDACYACVRSLRSSTCNAKESAARALCNPPTILSPSHHHHHTTPI